MDSASSGCFRRGYDHPRVRTKYFSQSLRPGQARKYICSTGYNIYMLVLKIF